MKKQFNLDYVGIGAQKAGTTWLSIILRAHPETCVSIPKEVNFFNTQGSFYETALGKDYPNFDKYARHFSHGNKSQLMGEVSPNYLYDLGTAKRLYTHFPNVKILVCLRDPVKRAFSQYNFSRYKHKAEAREFDDAIRQEPEYVERGLYYKQLKPYFELFAFEQFYFLTIEDIKNKPLETCKAVYSFLGVNTTHIPETIYQKSNPTQKSRFTWLLYFERFVKRILIQLKLGRLIVWLKKRGLHQIYLRYNFFDHEFPKMPEKSHLFLKAQFQEDIEQLELLLGKDFSNWK